MEKQEDFRSQSDSVLMVDAIKKVMRICNEHDVVCWLNYGALLGMVREGRLLPWNNDAELCCWYKPGISQNFQRIVDELNSIGYACYFYSSIGAMSVRREGVIVNVNCLWKEGDSVVRPHETAAQAGYAPFASRVFYWIATFLAAYPSGFVKYNDHKNLGKNIIKSVLVTSCRLLPRSIRKNLFTVMINISGQLGGEFKKTSIPARYFKEFKNIEFYGDEVLIPTHPEDLLNCIYGNDWSIPKANWSFYDKKNKNDTGVLFLDEKWNYEGAELL